MPAGPLVRLDRERRRCRVYDPRTLAAGGTNADDISDALRELKIAIYKENTSPMWHREEQVRQQHPDLVVSHLSGFADLRWAPTGTDLDEALFEVAQNRLTSFFAYQAVTAVGATYALHATVGRLLKPAVQLAGFTYSPRKIVAWLTSRNSIKGMFCECRDVVRDHYTRPSSAAHSRTEVSSAPQSEVWPARVGVPTQPRKSIVILLYIAAQLLSVAATLVARVAMSNSTHRSYPPLV